MGFDWDPAKSEATFRNRGFDFAYASRIFAGYRLETIDARADYGEVRIRAIGRVGPDILTVIYTMRGSTVRLISARRANKRSETGGTHAHDIGTDHGSWRRQDRPSQT